MPNKTSNNCPNSPTTDKEAHEWIELLQTDKTGEAHLLWLKQEALMGSDNEQLDEPECRGSNTRAMVWKSFDPLRAPAATAIFKEWHVAKSWLTELHNVESVFDDDSRCFAHAVIHGRIQGVREALARDGFEESPFDTPAWILHGALKLLLTNQDEAEQFPEEVSVLLRAIWFRADEDGYDTGFGLCLPGEAGKRLDRFIAGDATTLPTAKFSSYISDEQKTQYYQRGLVTAHSGSYHAHKLVTHAELSKTFPVAVALFWMFYGSDLPNELVDIWPVSVRDTFRLLEALGQDAKSACLTAWEQYRMLPELSRGLPSLEGPSA